MGYAVSGTSTGTGAASTTLPGKPGSRCLPRAAVSSGSIVPFRPTVARASIALCAVLLGCLSASAQESGAPGLSDSEVERLRGLLLRHQNSTSEAVKAESPPSETVDTLSLDADPGESELALLLEAPYSRDKLLLRADEWPLLRTEVENRLSDTAIAERRSNSPLIGTIQIRRRGSLVGSSTYNLRHIGKHQFVGQTELGDGLNIFGVSDFQWEIALPPLEGSSKYLLLLTAPPDQDWILHLVPASILADMQSDEPPWLRNPSAETSTAP